MNPIVPGLAGRAEASPQLGEPAPVRVPVSLSACSPPSMPGRGFTVAQGVPPERPNEDTDPTTSQTALDCQSIRESCMTIRLRLTWHTVL